MFRPRLKMVEKEEEAAFPSVAFRRNGGVLSLRRSRGIYMF